MDSEGQIFKMCHRLPGKILWDHGPIYVYLWPWVLIAIDVFTQQMFFRIYNVKGILIKYKAYICKHTNLKLKILKV